MKTSTRKAAVVCLLCVCTASAQLNLHSAETKPKEKAGKIAPTQLEGTIVGVDKSAHTVSISVRGKALKVNLTAQVRITRKGKPANLDELVIGQIVNITLLELPNGRLEVVAISIESSPTPIQPAGGAKSPANNDSGTSPFPSSPNPANTGGGVVSPHR